MIALLNKLYLWRTRFLKPLDVLDFKTQFGQVQRVLVYLPGEIERERVEFILGRTSECLPSCYVEYLIHQKFPVDWRNLLSGRNQSFQQIRKEDVGFLKTLKKTFIEMLRDKKFDLILDFSYLLDYSAALAFRACDARLIVGSLADPRADRFHNVLIKAHDAPAYDGMVFDCLSQWRG